MEYGSGSSSSDDDAIMGRDEDEDTIHMTPQLWRSGSRGDGSANMFGPTISSSPGTDDFGGPSSIATKLMSFQRVRTKKRRSKKSSSSTNGNVMRSPGPGSPPLLMRSIERSLTGESHRDASKQEIDSRRKSLSLGTGNIELSDDDQIEGGGKSAINSQEETMVSVPATPSDERRSVVRRAVSRRGNLLVSHHIQRTHSSNCARRHPLS